MIADVNANNTYDEVMRYYKRVTVCVCVFVGDSLFIARTVHAALLLLSLFFSSSSLLLF